ncbi:MAG: hypothetical protein OEY49_17110 [Candidatus Heimdallarchaeota archaeon]|nr:hypothetical protein [Candidatus Heimdallarchaeota archaeon]
MSKDEDDYFDELMKVAYKDGIITESEKSLISSTMKNIEKYRSVLIAALEDGVITAEERDQLLHSRNEILNQSYLTAKEGKRIFTDELRLLTSIQEIVNKLELKEDKI